LCSSVLSLLPNADPHQRCEGHESEPDWCSTTRFVQQLS
jgi:hypothetical protein